MTNLVPQGQGADALAPVIDYLESIQDSYSGNAKQFIAWIKAHGFTAEALRAYFAEVTRQYRASTARTKRQAAFSRLTRIAALPAWTPEQRAQIGWMIEELRHDAPPPRVPVSVGRDKVLSTSEYKAVLAHTRGPRDKAFFKFFWATGARVSEALAVEVKDCSVQGQIVAIRLRVTKTRTERLVYIRTALYDEIRAIFGGDTLLFSTRNGAAYNYTQVSTRMKAITTAALGRGLSVHKLRHSAATRLLEAGRSVDEVAQILGHATPVTTLRYYSHVLVDPAAVVAALAV